jgi:hypothetical protein
MSVIKFLYLNDIPGGTDVSVQFDDTDRPFIEDLLCAFEQFLLGMTFHPNTISKYLDTSRVQRALLERAQLMSDFKRASVHRVPEPPAKEPAKAKTKKFA